MTGAARGQGAAIVKRLHRDGYRVAACDMRADELAASVDGLDGVAAVSLDVTSEEQWNSAVRETSRVRVLDDLDQQCGCPAPCVARRRDSRGFESSWRFNCLGPFLGIRSTLPHLRAADGAAIVNTCSTGAIRPFPNHTAYGSSKWALRGLTQAVAAELAPSGIRVNAVFPGPIATPMLDAATQARLAGTAAFGRIGEPGEVADAVAFLASTQASFITGSELVVDGGQILKIG